MERTKVHFVTINTSKDGIMILFSDNMENMPHTKKHTKNTFTLSLVSNAHVKKNTNYPKQIPKTWTQTNFVSLTIKKGQPNKSLSNIKFLLNEVHVSL